MSDQTITARRATLEDLARLEAGGYRVERIAGHGWTLEAIGDPGQLMIADYGCIAPTQWEAAAEGLARIAQDERIAAEGTRAPTSSSPPAPLFASAPFAQIRGQTAITWDAEPLYCAETAAELEAGAELARLEAARGASLVAAFTDEAPAVELAGAIGGRLEAGQLHGRATYEVHHAA